MSRFGWGISDEVFNGDYPTREEALAAGMAEEPDAEQIWTAEGRTPSIDYQGLAETALESLVEQLCDECGQDAAEHWDPPSPALIEAIAASIEKHIAELQPIKCWSAENVQEHEIAQPPTKTRQ